MSIHDEYIRGLAPETAERWACMVERCRPVLEAEGMAAVQVLLAEAGTPAIEATAITLALVGWDEAALSVAIDSVATCPARMRAASCEGPEG